MKNHQILLILLMLLTSLTMSAGEIDLLQEYRRLDEAIGQSEKYVQAREERIAKLKTALEVTRAVNAQYDLCHGLYEEYHSYVNDSAMFYLGRCIELAKDMGDQTRGDECRLELAYQCSETGMYHEAADLLQDIDDQQLDAANLRRYNIAMAHLYGELGYYCKVPPLQQDYYARRDTYNGRLTAEADGSDEYLQVKEMECFGAQDAKGALAFNDMRLKQVKEGSHEYAIVAFYRHLDYRLLGDSIQARYWVTQSALSDVTNAVMDQGAMWELANMLMADGDMERAYRYIRFAWQCAGKFNTLKRNNQISPVMTAISDDYETSLKRANSLLLALVIVASLLAGLLLMILFYSNSQRKKLARARNELSDSNTQLAQLNAQLKDLNSQMRETNAKLGESNRVKDEYVGRFIHLCSFYIDRLDEMRKRIHKMVKSKDLDALYKFTEGNDLRDKNLTELYGMFDTTFLHLFPNFVNDFNALLRPECRIELPEDGVLNTDIRIFALIRLGIEDSSRIAEFLHYSVNTIYNYRAKIKNGALGDRDNFEARVKAISL
ncbi:MAG: transcriptional regulator [Muribaculaceae bacterium]|nr:transcriptional regulator [Muribaculaceae bacterium]